MDISIWIAIYLPIFFVIFIILPAQKRRIGVLKKIKKKRGLIKMSNELIKNYIGKKCTIAISGGFGQTYSKVKIVEIIDNWIKVESKGKEDLINIDYIQSIKILS